MCVFLEQQKHVNFYLKIKIFLDITKTQINQQKIKQTDTNLHYTFSAQQLNFYGTENGPVVSLLCYIHILKLINILFFLLHTAYVCADVCTYVCTSVN